MEDLGVRGLPMAGRRPRVTRAHDRQSTLVRELADACVAERSNACADNCGGNTDVTHADDAL